MSHPQSTFRQLLRRAFGERVVSRLGLLRDQVRVATFRSYVAAHRYGGVMRRVRIADAMSKDWYDHDWPRFPPLDVLEARGRSLAGMRVFDIGAHHGVVAMMLAEAVGRDGQVVAVEATARNAEVARENAELNGLPQLLVVHAAGAASDGTLEFAPRANGHVASDSEASVRVAAVSIDSLAARYGAPSVVMIDVEGFELDVLAGASGVLRDHRPDLILEVHVGEGLDRWGSADDVIALIPRDYDILVSRDEGGPYVPLEQARSLLSARFHVIAMP